MRRDGVSLTWLELKHMADACHDQFARRQSHLYLTFYNDDAGMLVDLVLLKLLPGWNAQQDRPCIIGRGQDLRLMRLYHNAL